jgi:hypothetical protein
VEVHRGDQAGTAFEPERARRLNKAAAPWRGYLVGSTTSLSGVTGSMAASLPCCARSGRS